MTILNSWMVWVEYIGVIAFAISGAMTAQEKNMDFFGAAILGMVTATGGGVIRDILLGITPPSMFRNPTYAIIAIISAIIVELTPIRRALAKRHSLRDMLVLICDTAGLGVFAVMGVRTAIGAFPDSNVFVLLFTGTLTGCGGSILRDMLAGQTPAIFSKRIYAIACLAGALVCALLWRYSSPLAMASGAILVWVLRGLAICFHWNLPTVGDNG